MRSMLHVGCSACCAHVKTRSDVRAAKLPIVLCGECVRLRSRVTPLHTPHNPISSLRDMGIRRVTEMHCLGVRRIMFSSQGDAWEGRTNVPCHATACRRVIPQRLSSDRGPISVARLLVTSTRPTTKKKEYTHAPRLRSHASHMGPHPH